MKVDGPEPDIFTYNIMILSFGRAGKVHEAVTIFEHLENSDCKPDIISYNSVINCLGKNGDVDEAHMRFKEMQEKGFSPDVVTYSTLIECFGKTDRVEMACRLFDNMLSQGCYPNIVTYNILLDCLERVVHIGELGFVGRVRSQVGLCEPFKVMNGVDIPNFALLLVWSLPPKAEACGCCCDYSRNLLPTEPSRPGPVLFAE
ncbi:hypothetical protein ACFX13_020351 [Malus domestica]